MKRFCPHCGYDQFGRIPAAGGRMRCLECEQDIEAGDLQTFSRRAWWWYWVVLPWCLAPATAGMIAPLLDKLIPGYALTERITFSALAMSPVFLYGLLCWIFAMHRLARWYFGAIVAALGLSVANALLIALVYLMRV